jgi:hypothetical protein
MQKVVGSSPIIRSRGSPAISPRLRWARYADPFDAPSLDRAGALETVVAVREWATRVIGTKEPEKLQPDSSPGSETPASQ